MATDKKEKKLSLNSFVSVKFIPRKPCGVSLTSHNKLKLDVRRRKKKIFYDKMYDEKLVDTTPTQRNLLNKIINYRENEET